MGCFRSSCFPLLASLRWIYQYVHNYGYAIIILTFLLSLLLFPFRLKQMLSMKKMQVVQPKVKAIQEKYRRYKKTDPKRAEMNQEIMALYKEHNVNPLGGCLPLLLQMPLLFAFYSLLAYSIELRQAPFMRWIQDLSRQGSILCASDHHGDHDVYFAEDDADDAGNGSDAGEDDDDDAGDLHGHVLQCFERLEPVFSLQ